MRKRIQPDGNPTLRLRTMDWPMIHPSDTTEFSPASPTMLALYRSRLLMAGGILAFTAVIHLAYVDRISSVFAYLGYLYVPLDGLNTAFALLLIIVPVMFLPVGISRPSQFLAWLLYIFVHIPTVMMFAYLTGSAFTFVLFNVFVILSIFVVSSLGRLPTWRLPRHALSARRFTVLVLVLSGVANALILFQFGFRFDLPAFSEVYGVRALFSENIASMARGIGYLTNWQGNVLNPLLLGIGLFRRAPLVFLFGAVSQLYLYSLSGKKLLLLGPVILIVIIAWALKGNGAKFGNRLVGIVLGGSALALASDYVFDSIQGSSLVIRRGLAITGLDTLRYVEFFAMNPPALLAHSILRGIAPANYTVDPKVVIASHYGGSLGPNANIFADAFANFHYFGLVVLIGALFVVLRFVDSAAVGRPLSLALLALGIPMFAFTQAAFLTTLLTHGGLLAIVLLLLMPSAADWNVRATMKEESKYAFLRLFAT